MGKERAYSAKPSITSGDQCRASLPGPPRRHGGRRGRWGQVRPVGAGEANGGRKPPGQIPCQQFGGSNFLELRDKRAT